MKKHNSKTYIYKIYECKFECLHDSIVVSIPACHAGDRGSIPRRGAFFIRIFEQINSISVSYNCFTRILTIRHFINFWLCST